jgi:hypothetical protein
MSQILDGIPFNELSEDHLNSLVKLRIPESSRIEYKSELKISNDSDKREFCKDVSALSNSLGGYIFFGIAENDGWPSDIPGITFNETILQQLYQILTSGISPRLQVVTETVIPLKKGNTVLVIKVQPDGYLHQVKYHDNRFYKRTGTITVLMESSDVETFFNAKSQKPTNDRMQESISEYHSALKTKKYFKGINGKGICALYISPEIDSYKINLSNIPDNFTALFKPLYCSGWSSEISGRTVYTIGSGRDEKTPFAVTAVNERGEVKAYNSFLFENPFGKQYVAEGSVGYIPSIAYEREYIHSVHLYLNSLSELGVQVPFYVQIALLNVRGYTLAVDQFRFGTSRIIQQDDILPDVIHIQSESQFKTHSDVAKILKFSFDFIWREFGFERSFNYNSEDVWDAERK